MSAGFPTSDTTDANRVDTAAAPSQASFVGSLVEAKGVMAAAVAGSVGALALGMASTEAIHFGATVALGASLGDAVLTGLGYQTSVASYMPTSISTYVDPLDFFGGALGTAALAMMMGARDSMDLLKLAGLGGLAAGVAPKLAGTILSKTQ